MFFSNSIWFWIHSSFLRHCGMENSSLYCELNMCFKPGFSEGKSSYLDQGNHLHYSFETGGENFACLCWPDDQPKEERLRECLNSGWYVRALKFPSFSNTWATPITKSSKYNLELTIAQSWCNFSMQVSNLTSLTQACHGTFNLNNFCLNLL